jgi:hypothetical protein
MHNKQVAYCIAALAFIATSIQLLKWDMFRHAYIRQSLELPKLT